MGNEFKIIDPFKVFRTIIQNKGQFSIFLGAGASVEAKVPTADMICQEIASDIISLENERREVTNEKLLDTENDKKQWLNDTVSWDDDESRYSTSIKYLYSQQSERIDYFRRMLHGKNPSFIHYATAILMHHGYLTRTCISTNFDKLLEKGFSELNLTECQAIRLEDEAKYWRQEDNKCYCLKLHGDYDTFNILNTNSETISINPELRRCTEEVIKHSGLLVLGSAGREKSIHTLFDTLTESKKMEEKGLLEYGILWGVHIGNSPPKDFKPSTLESVVNESIKNGAIGKEVIKLMTRLSNSERQFGFFPMWGSGRFFWDLIKISKDERLVHLSEPYLDHEIRVSDVFRRAGLSDNASAEHLKQLKIQQDKISRPQQYIKSEAIVNLQFRDKVKIIVAYGDLSSESMLNIVTNKNGLKALVSPDDTCLSVGGGAALAIVQKSGLRRTLFELSKFSPIPLEDNVVTSGGGLPVHYIIHVAGVKITEEGAQTSPEIIKNTVQKVIEKAIALNVDSLWIPLIGAGVAKNDPKASLESILQALKEETTSQSLKKELNIIIAVFNESTLGRDAIKIIFQDTLSIKIS